MRARVDLEQTQTWEQLIAWNSCLYNLVIEQIKRIGGGGLLNRDHQVAVPGHQHFSVTCALELCAFLTLYLLDGRCRQKPAETEAPEWQRHLMMPWASPPRSRPAGCFHNAAPKSVESIRFCKTEINSTSKCRKAVIQISGLIYYPPGTALPGANSTLNMWSASSSLTLLFSCKATMAATSSPGWESAIWWVKAVG